MLILDRFEEHFALIEDDGELFSVDRALLSPDVQEGDVLIRDGDGLYRADKTATLKRRERMKSRLNRLKKTR